MRKKTIDQTDIRIINELQKNSRITNKELANLVGLSEPPTLLRVRRLFEDKHILRVISEPNYRQFGYNKRQYHLVKILKEDVDEFAKEAQTERFIIKLDRIEESSNRIKTATFIIVTQCKTKEQSQGIINNILKNYNVFDYIDYNVTSTYKNDILLLDEKIDHIK